MIYEKKYSLFSFIVLLALPVHSQTSWVNVDRAAFSSGSATYTFIALDNSGTPYLAYSDGANNNKATVKKYIDTGWTTVGNEGFSAGGVSYVSLAIDKYGTPYAAFAAMQPGQEHKTCLIYLLILP